VTESDLQVLKESIDKLVKITCSDGEILLAKVHAVSDEDEDVVYELVATTKESHYEKRDEQPAYLIAFRDIERVESFRGPQRIRRDYESAHGIGGVLPGPCLYLAVACGAGFSRLLFRLFRLIHGRSTVG
jgi:small nuclear ribonucleoprotein (snRNP)-like protein